MATGDPSLSTSTIGQIARRASTPAELVGADFETELTNPDSSKSSAKVGMGVLVQAFNQNLAGPNNRKDLRKGVRCYDATHPFYLAGDSTLVDLNTNYLCLFTEALVEFGPDGYARTYILLYDATGPLQVFVDGRFSGPLIRARWVLKEVADAGMTGIASFNNLTTRYAAGSQVVHNERLWQTDTELIRANQTGNIIPTPSESEGNPWHEISRASSSALYEYVGVTLARQLQAEEEFQPGRLYIIRSEAGDVYVHALTGGSLAALAHQQTEDGLVIGTYDLATDTFAAGGLGGGGDAAFTITPTESYNGTFTPGQPYTGTSRQFFTKLLVKYQAPGFNDFSIDDQRSRTLEVGTVIPAGFKSIKWSTSNSQNVAAASISLRDVTANTVLLTGEANDGVASASPVSFTVVNGESRRYRLTAKNSQNQDFATDLTISGAYRIFYGPASATPATSAQVRALPASRFASEGNQFTLNTGSTSNRFAVWLPAGKTITSVVDQDALGADVTSQYVGSALSVNDAGGTAVAGTLFVMSPAVPYSTSHRHLVTVS